MATTWHLLVGTFDVPAIYTLAFTSNLTTSPPTYSLSVVHTSEASGPHSWLALSVRTMHCSPSAKTHPMRPTGRRNKIVHNNLDLSPFPLLLRTLQNLIHSYSDPPEFSPYRLSIRLRLHLLNDLVLRRRSDWRSLPPRSRDREYRKGDSEVGF